MSVTTHFTPLLGAFGVGPLCYLLEIDNCRLLLDCGWDDSFSVKQLERLEKEIKIGFDAVLLSHLDLAHIGALPYAVGKLGLRAPIYATTPIKKFGRLLFYDIHDSKTMEQDFDVFSMEDIDTAFENIIELRYDQPVTLDHYEIEMTPHCAGHLIGGSFWKIQKETDKIIYAVDYNHAKERHLNPTKLTMITRPSLMITDAYNAKKQIPQRRDRDKDLLKSIQSTVLQSGDVLIPVDASGRVLELLLLLDQEWSKLRLQHAQLAFLSHTSYSTLDFAKSNLEWMNVKLDMADNPYELRNVTTCTNLEELEELPRPRVVLATVPTLDCGFSRSLFEIWAQQANNLIIFTTRQREDSLSSILLRDYTENTVAGLPLTFESRRRIPLEGEELEAFLLQKEQEKIAELEKEEVKDIDMVDEEEPEEIIPLLPTSYFEHSFDLVTANMDPVFRQAHPMFPFQEEMTDWDAYGEQVNWEAIKQSTAGENDYFMNDDDDDDQLDKEDENIVPTKPVCESIEVIVRSPVKYIDFEGRSDGTSMKNVISLMEPSKVILIHGTEDSCAELLNHCQKTDGCRNTEFLTPRMGERIDVTSGTMTYKLKLSQSLINSQRFSFVDGYNVAFVNGKICFRSVDKKEKKSDTEIGDGDGDAMEEDTGMEPYLIELPENERPGHNAVIVGYTRLVDLRAALLDKNFTAELEGGVLLCNNLVTVRKSKGASQFQVDGPLCDDYFRIRDLLYEQFSVL